MGWRKGEKLGGSVEGQKLKNGKFSIQIVTNFQLEEKNGFYGFIGGDVLSFWGFRGSKV